MSKDNKKKRRYTIRLVCDVLGDGIVLGHHQIETVYDGEPGGKTGQIGDTEHLQFLVESAQGYAKVVTVAAMSKASEEMARRWGGEGEPEPDSDTVAMLKQAPDSA